VRGFAGIIEGKYDHIPEGFFLYRGSIEEVEASYAEANN
jgi:F-type H+-transporting ATPase subunit beta